jgi:ABC-type Fe3+/spermidine/putrescine transport system ATPase subunit
MTTLLRTESITRRFGGITAVDDCSISVEQGSITGLIGPNGSGKTTLFNLITNIYKPDTGSAFMREKKITGLAPHRLCHQGLSRTFQITRLFWDLSVLENMIADQLERLPARVNPIETKLQRPIGALFLEVGMIVDHPGDDGSAAQVDAPRIRPRQARDVLVGADGDEAIASNRHGLRDREPIIDGDDLSIRQDDVRSGGPLSGEQDRDSRHSGYDKC